MAVKHPELVLAGAVVVCLPMASGILSGNISVQTAAVHFLIALVVCWVLGMVLSWVFTTYGEQARRRKIEEMILGMTRRDADSADKSNPSGRSGQSGQ